jgi:hypothetical protein
MTHMGEPPPLREPRGAGCQVPTDCTGVAPTREDWWWRSFWWWLW